MKSQFAELLVSVQNVSVAYGETQVLNGISFDVYNTIGHGQVVALLGRSGVGKTQLFRIISGLQSPNSGGVYIDSQPEPVREGEVGVVAQDYPLIESRTVVDNLLRAYAVRNGRGKKKEATEIAMKYLDDFGLQFIAKHLPSEISGGQRQRVAIIQQMMCSRHYLIMDEPFSGLDIVSKDDACALITGMSNQHELNTVILTTHDVRTACAVADRVIVIGRDRDGKGNLIPGSRVFFDLDLKEEDLCWDPEIHKTARFKEFVDKVEDQIRVL
jgi:ABC-type nitrate/sulfonate/bicarbonate transport system ATPase subunit